MKEIITLKRILLIIFSILALVGCSNASAELRNSELEQAINSMLSDENTSEIDLNTVVDFDWDKALLFQPYTTQESMNEQLGFEFNDPSNIDKRDDIYLLVFVSDSQVVQYVELSRQQANIEVTEITPSNAIISINH